MSETGELYRKNRELTIKMLIKRWPLFASICILWGTLALLAIVSFKYNQNHLTYATDDAYIGMAVAKNYAQRGYWSVSKSAEFTSLSSTLLWTLILSAIYRFIAPNEISPFILSFIFSTLLLLIVYIILYNYNLQSKYIFATLLAIIFFTPLPALVFGGLEHVLAIIITICFAYINSVILSREKNANIYYLSSLALAILLSMARYEGLFLAFVVSILFALRNKLKFSGILFCLSVLPIAIYGVISYHNGWFFLPNSLMLKAKIPEYFNPSRPFLLQIVNVHNYIGSFFKNLYEPQIIVLIVIVSMSFIFFYYIKFDFWNISTILIAIFVPTTCLHMLFARTGWFFRYEAYLIALGLFIIALISKDLMAHNKFISFKLNKYEIFNNFPKLALLVLIMLIFISPFAYRAASSILEIPLATKNVYEQQYQMGLFLKEFYEGDAIAANDIGAINYLADIKCIDLAGLGTIDVAKAMRNGNYNAQFIYNLTKNGKIAIIYDIWKIPPNWIKVGQWTIPNNIICGDDTISFYAINENETTKLIENLKNFSLKLPKDVKQHGRYLD